jgi:hypothetical protein
VGPAAQAAGGGVRQDRPGGQVRHAHHLLAAVRQLTRADALTLAGVPTGAKVTVTCQGKGCAFKKMTLTATGTKIKPPTASKRRKLAPTP